MMTIFTLRATPFRSILILAFYLLTTIHVRPAVAQGRSVPALNTSESDPFPKFLNSTPEIISTLGTTDSEVDGFAITTKRIVFSSKSNTNKVFAILSEPKKEGMYPAVLIIHGGGGNAESMKSMVEEYARRGYVTLTFDIPGLSGPDRTPHSFGPWKLREWGEPARFDVVESVDNSTLFDAEVAGLEAFNLLSSLPKVDRKNIGITGFSWGGYSTTMLSGLLGKRVKAAYSVWGSGFYEKGSFWKQIIADLVEHDRNTWLTYYDAGRRAPKIDAYFFLEAATNDTYFWPEAVSATLEAIPRRKNHVWAPNINHQRVSSGANMQRMFFDYHLKGEGSSFGRVSISKIKSRKDGSRILAFHTEVAKGITVDSVKVYYSEKGSPWQKRLWKPINAVRTAANRYTAVIPAEILSIGVDFFAYATDSRKISVSSPMYKIKGKAGSPSLVDAP